MVAIIFLIVIIVVFAIILTGIWLFTNITAINILQDQIGLKKCPFCAEIIQPEAIVCRFCNRDLVK